ncbi:MAG: outer membrane protein assembly factor BamD [Bacteroidales bacterium]|jgi:outer membrane protein assembly factor BamD|nr:outer membrane protein assembly factor BamD [Bacteroidales bacterium]
MKLSKYLIIISLTSFLLLVSSCSNYSKILKSDDKDLIYNEAMVQYEKGNYINALQLFDKILMLVKGTDKEEPVSYYYAQCYYEQGDYILANYYFRKYARQYIHSPRAEESAFLAAMCKYYQSSTYSLDPSPTTDAISELQAYINAYPNSDRIELCNSYIDELRAKLEEKDYQIALMYLRMDEYKAAVVCFENILKDFPDTKHREDIYYYLVKAKYEFAKNSVESKKTERFDDVYNAYTKFISNFPDSRYIAEIEQYNKAAKQYK